MLPRTSFLARLIGLFLIVVSLAMLVQKQGLAPAISALVQDRTALLVVAMIGLAAGLAMILVHNVWSRGVLPVVVTLIGSFLMLRDALVLFLPPEALRALFDAFHVERFYTSTRSLICYRHPPDLRRFQSGVRGEEGAQPCLRGEAKAS